MSSNRLIIIGGGISGLYTAYKLQHKYSITLIESKPDLGGRIRTKYDKKGNILYEKGPWRIHENHKRCIHLLRKLGLHCSKIPSTDIKKRVNKSSDDNPNISTWDHIMFRTNPVNAMKQSVKTGYGDGLFDEAKGANVYRSNSDGNYYIVTEGLSEIVKRLKQHIEKNVNIQLGVKVKDIEYKNKQYFVTCLKRKGLQFKPVSYESDKLIAAVPPHALKEWPIYNRYDEFRMNFSKIDSYSLMHVYFNASSSLMQKIKCVFEKKNSISYFHEKHFGIGSQLIMSQYQNNYIQLAYVGGRYAKSLQRFRLYDFQKFKTLLERDLVNVLQSKQLNIYFRNEIKRDFNQDDRFHVCYFEHAVHQWKPSYNLALRASMKQTALYFNPIRLPEFYIIGESISLIQGWIEGALQTSELVIDCLKKNESWKKDFKLATKLDTTRHYMRYKYWLLDVTDWIQRHPGGEKAILKYTIKHLKKESMHFLFKHNHDSDYTYSILANLRCGIIDSENNIYLLK